MRLHKFLLAAIAILSVAATAKADIVRFDFQINGSNPEFAAALDSPSPFTATLDGITFTASSSANNDGATNPNTGTSGFGVNSTVAGDSNTQIDPGEILTLAVTFDPAAFEKVQLANIDLGNIGGATDGAVVALPNGTTLTYSDDATAPAGFEFNNNDNIAPTTPIALNSGDAFVFSTPVGNTGEFRVQRISLHLPPVPEVVPEPSSLALLGLLGGVVAIRRRR